LAIKRITLPVFGGILGLCKTTCSMVVKQG